MQIGKVGKRVGLSVDAIRFYERNALLPRPPRTQGGFRQFDESDVETLGFIRRVQNLGFTLREIRDLLELRRTRLRPCAPAPPSGRKTGRCPAEGFRSREIGA